MGLLSSYNANPCTRHLTAAKRVLRYLKKTKDLKLVYTKHENDGHNLYGFVDSDWAKSLKRKSIGGYVFTLGNAAISCSSKKQTLIALSTKKPNTRHLWKQVKKRSGYANSYWITIIEEASTTQNHLQQTQALPPYTLITKEQSSMPTPKE